MTDQAPFPPPSPRSDHLHVEKVSKIDKKTGETSLTFSPEQSRAVAESGRVKDITNKYILLIKNRIAELSAQSASLKKDAEILDHEIINLNHEMLLAEKSANDGYSDTLKMIISSFETPPPPWKASLRMEQGVPVGANLTQEPPVNSKL